ncbi:MAG: hypothetical protein ACLFQ6_03810 [Candidatus Sumerlaeia bacterium]
MKAYCHVVAVIIGFTSLAALAIKSSPVWGFLFFVPFSLFPHFITHLLIANFRSSAALAVLTITDILFFAWFAYVYAIIFYVDIDPQGAIGLIFLGIYSMPVVLPLWIVAVLLELRWRTARRQKDTGRLA